MFKELLCFGALLALTQATALGFQARDGARNRYYGYNYNKRINGVELTDSESIKATFEKDAPIIVLVHGQGALIDDVLQYEILSESYPNLVIVDWTMYSNRGYLAAANAVPSIGYGLANDFLIEAVFAGWELYDIHLIGFDLGAHVCGFAGRERNGAIGKITGLNPSGQNWGTNSGHLSKGDALQVEVIHTENRNYGIGTAIGDLDYFINNGITQPGCTNNLCSHNRAVDIMAASIHNTITGYQCTSMSEMQRNVCRGRSVAVGSLDFRKRGSGIHRANTSNRWPWGLATI